MSWLHEPDRPPTRQDDVQLKHARARELLNDLQLDVLFLEDRENFAWYTSGGRNTLGSLGSTCAAVVVTRDEAVLLVDTAQSDWLQEEQLIGLDLDVRSVPWDSNLFDAASFITAGRRVGSDRGVRGTRNVARELARLRLDLTQLERERYRRLGRALTQSIEATARKVAPGDTETDVAAALAQRLFKRHLLPVEIYVVGEKRSAQYRRPPFGKAPIERHCWIGATAEAFGLCASAGRTVTFGRSDPAFGTDFEHATMAMAVGVYYAQPGVSSAAILERVERCYQRRGRAGEFALADVGQVIGYTICEQALRSASRYRLGDQVAMVWRPTIGQGRTCDTVIIDEGGFELVTSSR